MADKAKKTEGAPDEASRKARLFPPILSDASFSRNTPPDDVEKDVQGERFYDATLYQYGDSGVVQIAICDFMAGQKIKDVNILEVRATYFVGVHLDNYTATAAENKFALEELVSSSAWPMFRDLFSHIASQSGDELPLLPNAPTLRWIDPPKE